MTPELFSDAMNEIGAKYVEEALTYKRAKPRVLRRVLRTVLAAALISVLLFTSAFALSPSLREKAMTALVQIFSDHTEVRFDGSEEFEPHGTGAIDCSALEDEYTVVDSSEGGWRNFVRLERADGVELRVTTTEISDSLSYNFDSENCSETPVTLYGKDATLYVKQDGSNYVSIVQIDTERGWIIRFSAEGLTADELLDAAAHVEIL